MTFIACRLRLLFQGGGQSTDHFDMLDAIQQWVEKGQSPDRVIASGRMFPDNTRPLCPYPKAARFDGGNADDEKSFSCRRTEPHLHVLTGN